MRIIHLDEIKRVVNTINVAQCIEDGFIAYSEGRVVIPPVGELLFEDPPGETHIKYGYIKGDDYFVIKIASGFYENYKLDLPSGPGLMLLFNQKTGMLVSILLDECFLTNVRTAAAGEISAKYLAPKKINRIGVLGTGVQARMQVQYLQSVTSCKDIVVWGRSYKGLEAYKADMQKMGYSVLTTNNANDVADSCNLIVTATPSKNPLLFVDHIRKGTHITAMGSDTADKQELDPKILEKADIVVADSISQCVLRGEIYQTLNTGRIQKEDIVELGQVIVDRTLQRNSDDQITVADLTGVAVQDAQIAKAVYEALL